MKNDEEKRKKEKAPETGESYYRLCGRRIKLLAQNHHANSLENRSASVGARGERCLTLEEMSGKDETKWAKHWQCNSEVQDLATGVTDFTPKFRQTCEK